MEWPTRTRGPAKSWNRAQAAREIRLADELVVGDPVDTGSRRRNRLAGIDENFEPAFRFDLALQDADCADL